MPSKKNVPQSDLLSSVFNGAAIALVVQLLGIAVAYAMEVLLGRWMGATQYGAYDYVISIGTLLGFVACLGLSNSLLRFIPEYSVREDWGKLRGIVWGSWRYVFLSSILVTVVAIAVLIGWGKYSTKVAPSLLIGISAIPLWALVRHQREMARGIKRMALAYFPSAMFPLLVIVGAFYYHQNLSSNKAIAIAWLSLAFVVVFQLWLLKWRMPKQSSITKAIYVPREWFAVALPLLFNDSAFVLLSHTDTIMTGTILGSFEVGIYSAAFKTASGVSFILAGVNAIAAPMFATLHTQGDYEGLQELTATVARWLFYPSLAFALLLIIFADPVLGLFGSEFIAARWSMTILILGQLVNVGAGSVGYLMQMTGHHKKCAYVVGCSALLNVVLNSILIPTLGIMGAAIATATTMAIWNIWLHRLVVKHLGVYPSIISTFL